MKKILLLIVLSLCMLLFTACGSSQTMHSDADDGAGGFRSVTEKVFPDAPPSLTVTCGEAQIIAWRGTFSWEVRNALGVGEAVCADSMHPIDAARDHPETFPVLHAADGDSLQFCFEAPPDSMTVRYYREDADSYDPSGISHASALEVKPGLYEIVAKWNKTTENYSGTVHYAFRIE